MRVDRIAGIDLESSATGSPQIGRGSAVLLAVLASPPSTTSGVRTRNLPLLAAHILGYSRVDIVNLVSSPTASVLDIADLGHVAAPWVTARNEIAARLETSNVVLLAWGTTEPIGPARYRHCEQVPRLRSILADGRLERWTVGGSPRHPLRWQRFTHRHFPKQSFEDALRQLFCPDRKERSTFPPIRQTSHKTV